MITEIIDAKKEYKRAITTAAGLLRAGELVAFPTETVYGLGANAMSEQAVRSIFAVKGRPADNPLIVHIWEAGQVRQLAREISPMALKLMLALWPGPFTAVLQKRSGVPDVVTGGLDSVAIRMPGSRIAIDIIRESGRVVAAPSANLSGRPSPTSAEHVMDDLSGMIPLVVNGGPCAVGVESTVCDLRGEVPMILRPGGVTPQMIRKVSGDVRVHPGVLGGPVCGPAASPGMKYKHYAPRAEIVVVTGDKLDVAKKIGALYYNKKKKYAIMCTHENVSLYKGKNVIDLGEGGAENAHNLFAALREADEAGYEKVYFHAVDTSEIGLAIMNRMMRAAGHNVTVAVREDKID